MSPQYSYYLTIPSRIPQRPPYSGTLTINATQFSVYDYLASHCRSMTIGSTYGEVTRAKFIVRTLPRCPKITMLFQNYPQRFPCWLQIDIQGLFANAHRDSHLRLIFMYDTTDVDYSPRERYGYASEQHFYYPDPFTGVRTLEMRGANPCAVYMTVGVCPDLEVLETDVDGNVMQGGFDAANARPPASCPEEAYFFNENNWSSPTEEMLWPNRRRSPSVRLKSVPQPDRISGAKSSSSMRKRKSIQPSENVSLHMNTGGGKSSAGSDTIHAKKISFAHRMRTFLRIFCLVSNDFQAAILNS